MADGVVVWAVNFAAFAEILLRFCGIAEACQSADVDGDERLWIPYMQNGRNWTPSRTHVEVGVVLLLVSRLLGGGKPLYDDLTIDKLFVKLRARWSPSCLMRSLRCRSVGEPVCELLAAKKVVCEIKSGRRTDDGKVKQRERTRGSPRLGA